MIAAGDWTTYSDQDQHSLVSFNPETELFEDLGNWDLHLIEGSIAIDAGTSENAPSVDHDGVNRPQGEGYDVGAYEYQSHAHAYLVVRGLNNQIYYRTYISSGGSWDSWNVLPDGLTCDSPAAAICCGKLYIVVRGMDGCSLWFGSLNLSDRAFSGWTLLLGSTLSKPTLVCWNDTELYLFVRGNDNGIYYNVWDCSASSWTGWNGLPGATCDAPSAAVCGNKLHVTVIGMDQKLWHGYLDLSSSTWYGWTQLSGATTSAPVLASNGTYPHLIVQGLNNRIYYNTWNGSSWEGWTALPTGATCGSPAATILDGELHMVVRGMDGTGVWHNRLNLSTDDFSGWTTISGATPSAPTITS